MARRADPNARGSLIAAARIEFARRGILEARVEDITRRSKLSKGSFYLHFESKEALFASIIRDFRKTMRKARTEIHRRVAASTPIERLTGLEFPLDQELIELLWEWRDVIRVILNGTYGTKFEGIAWVLLDETVAWVEAQYQRLRRNSLVRRDLAPESLGLVIVGAYFMVTRRIAFAKKKPDLAALASSTRRLISDGLSAGRATPKKRSVPR